MAMISEEQIKEIRNSVNIVDVISSYIPLTKRGKNFFGVCPFHDDNNPSMSVSEEKQIYTCFSCGATGNVFKFIMDYEHVTFPESIKIVADKVGIEVNVTGNKKVNNNNLYDVYDLANKFYQNNLNTKKGIDAKEYLKNRDINDEIISAFEIGLSLKENDLLTNVLIKKKYDSITLEKSGLISKTSNGYKDMYYNRIMFPLWDLNGQVIGFSGRIYHDEDTSKYINTKETEIFKKGEILYNYHMAKDIARSTNKVIIVEGFMDVIRCYSIGIKNVIATMGTAVTKKQANLIKNMAKDIIICFDGDEAGFKATVSLTDMLMSINVNPKIIRLENNLDPDEYIKINGEQSFKDKINNPLNVMDFKMQSLKYNKDLTSTVDISKYVSEMLKEIDKIDDDVLKEVTLRKLSLDSNLDIEFLRKRLTKKETNQIIIKPKTLKIDKYEKANMYLLYYMLDNQEVIKIYKSKGIGIVNSKFSSLALAILSFYNKHKDISVADFISNNTNNEKIMNLVSQIVSLDLNKEYTIEDIDNYINVINEYNIKCEIDRLLKKQKEISDRKEKIKIGEQIRNLRMDGKND